MCRGKTHVVLKSIIMFFNVIALIVSVGLLTLVIMNQLPTSNIYALICLSASLLLAAILGFYIFWQEKILLIKVYAVLVLIILIVNFVIIFTPVDTDSLKAEVKSEIESKWNEEKDKPGSMDDFQSLEGSAPILYSRLSLLICVTCVLSISIFEYKCCGKHSADDYQYILQRAIPKSCYDSEDNTVYPRGCLTAREDSIKDSLPSGFFWFGVVWNITWLAIICYFIMYLKKLQ